jgi:DNA-binding NarL/FixJ family response regulator
LGTATIRIAARGSNGEGEAGTAVSIKVLIADDHRLILSAVRRALEAADDIEIVAEARRGSQVLPLVHQEQPDVCLLDVRMPEMDGLTCAERIREAAPDTRVVMLSASAEPESADEALVRGADAYVAKSVDPQELAAALRRVNDGESFRLGVVEPGAREDAAGLTERELSILQAVARGLSNQAISGELWITEQTVKFHLTNIYRKLEVSSRAEAARYALSRGIAAA